MEEFDIGRNIRNRRQMLNMTLAQLAEKSNLSTTMISEVERGLKMPSVKKAYQMALALNCTLSDLITGSVEAPIHIVRAEQKNKLLDQDSGIERGILSNALLSQGLELLWFTIPAQQSTAELPQNKDGVTEHITVINGTLSCKLNDKEYILEKGDSITYEAMKTEYSNPSNTDCEFILLIKSK